MDSVTQIALGAALGEATIGKHFGRRGLVWGGICGLFPDLDVLVPLGDAVKNFTYHRGPSHSLFVLAALTPVFVWLILKRHPETRALKKRWVLMVYLAFATHVVLDCLTVYGTQIFWPLPTPPAMWSTIFIIDPVYTVPLFVGIAAAFFLSRERGVGRTVNTVCLGLSTLYLVWTIGAKVHVNQVAHASLREQNISYQRLLTVPAPFNTLLWRVLAMGNNGYYEGYYSLFDKEKRVETRFYPSDRSLLRGVEDHWPVRRLEWFTHGFHAVKRMGKDIIITDLRMGSEPFYVFQFKIAEAGNPHSKPVKSERIRTRRGWEQLQYIWDRIWRDLTPASS
jgi:inner membrane protein